MRIIFLLLFSFGLLQATGQNFKPDNKTSDIRFTIKNIGLNVTGHLSGIQGIIYFNPSELGSAFFKIQIDATTINTGIKARDSHLRKEEYLYADRFPQISFLSKKITASVTLGEFFVTGTIKIKGIEKEISFPFTVLPINDGLEFKAQFKLNRRDFKVGSSSLVLSDNLMVSLSIPAVKEKQ